MFTYDPALVARYPSLRAGVIEVSDAPNGPSPDALVAAFAAEQHAAMAQLAGVALADLPSIAAWRRVFTSFGVSPTKYRNAAEALLRRVQKKGDVPSVGLLVDLGNLVSIRHRLPIAVIDADRVAGGVTVRMARGDEHFDDLGGTAAAPRRRGRWCSSMTPTRSSLGAGAGGNPPVPVSPPRPGG